MIFIQPKRALARPSRRGAWPQRAAATLLPLAFAFGPAPAVARGLSPTPQASVRGLRPPTATRYNFPPPSRGDRFARGGLDWARGEKGWRRWGSLIRSVAQREGVDPYVLGAYVWVESAFDPHQDYAAGGMRAIGLGSVQAQDHRRYSVGQLMNPELNLSLTAREFKACWRPQDMAGTVMDVWYPSWRRRLAQGRGIPVVGHPSVYVQAIANRYHALRRLDASRHEAARLESTRQEAAR